jgi:hypothetical protein
MLDLDSKMVRFEGGAKAIVDKLVAEKRERETLLLQEELVDLKKRLNEAHAGRMLYDALQKLVAGREASMKKLNARIKNNPQLFERFRKEQTKIEEDLQRALDGIRELRVPLSRRILLFFFGKRGKIVSYIIPRMLNDLSDPLIETAPTTIVVLSEGWSILISSGLIFVLQVLVKCVLGFGVLRLWRTTSRAL